MTKDDIIRMAREANGEEAWSGGVEWTWEEVERFAALVAAAEREACLKLAEKYMEPWTADAIRARGKQ